MAWPSTTSTMQAKRALSQNGTRFRGRATTPVIAYVGGDAALLILEAPGRE